MSDLVINADHLIVLPIEDTRANYVSGFWKWIEILAAGDYVRGLGALYWPDEVPFTPDTLKERITTFWGGPDPWSVVIPNERLMSVIDDGAEFASPTGGRPGWFMAQIPVTTEPERSKADDVILMGVAVSFFVREWNGGYVFEFEIFHA